MRKFGMFIFGVIAGGVLGSAIALLFTPSSGNSLRIQISDYSSKLKDDISQAAKERRAALEQELANLRQSKKTS